MSVILPSRICFGKIHICVEDFEANNDLSIAVADSTSKRNLIMIGLPPWCVLAQFRGQIQSHAIFHFFLITKGIHEIKFTSPSKSIGSYKTFINSLKTYLFTIS